MLKKIVRKSSSLKGLNFEYLVVKKIKEYLLKKKRLAYCYRLKQSKYTSQHFDILCDSKEKDLYLAIQCKSTKNEKVLYVTSHVKNQLKKYEQILNIILNSGRAYYLVCKFGKIGYSTYDADEISTGLKEGKFINKNNGILPQLLINADSES